MAWRKHAIVISLATERDSGISVPWARDAEGNSMKTFRRIAAALVVGLGLWMSVATPTLAGYGNHAERATANIKTRVGIGVVQINAQLDIIKANAAERQAALP